MTFNKPVVPKTLSTAPLEYPAMDYDLLRQEGIEHIARLSGQVWTDFNTHDPGITILEQLCYAITDLAHRINYEVPDLLTGADGNTYVSLYGPAEVLPTKPVTLNDLRKLMIDVPGVKNAWVEKAEQTLLYDPNDRSLQNSDTINSTVINNSVVLKGVFRVLVELLDLQYLDESATPSNPDAILASVVQRLNENRGLCEDFEYPLIELQPQKIQVTATIEIGTVDDAESLLVDIYQRIAEYISPSVPFRTLAQMLAAGYTVDEIFDGPLLEHGFIEQTALAQNRRTSLRTSDLINIIMDVPGVRMVRKLRIATDVMKSDGNDEAPSWFLDLDPSNAAKLDLRGSNIQLERNQVAVSAILTERAKNTYYATLRASAEAQNTAVNEPDMPSGVYKDPGKYYSVQHQFPSTYGIGAMGLPNSATAQRKAEAKQLQAYLLFFDQLLANYFAQLANIKDLFSFSEIPLEPDSSRTYFSQLINDETLQLDDVLGTDLGEPQNKLQDFTDPLVAGNTDAAYLRRNRFLNHLLARFAEQFTDYSLILYGVTSTQNGPTAASLVRDKQAFLKDYPQIGSSRGSAFNYQQPWSPENSSGLEKRLRRKLGLGDEGEDRFYVVEHILLRPIKKDESQKIPMLADAQSKDPYSLKLSFIFPSYTERFSNADFVSFAERAIREETPAHLVPYIHWFAKDQMTAFKSAYDEWVGYRRAYGTGL